MSDIFREVDEDLRQERYKKLWDKHGRTLIGAAVALVLAVGGFQAWKAWDQSQRIALSDRYAEALDLATEGQREAAQDRLSRLSGPDDGGYGTLAAFERARILADSGDRDGAIAIWDELASLRGIGPAFQGLAEMLSVMNQLDDGDPAELEARLTPLTVEGGPFRATALELMAALALRQNDKDRARELYTRLADDRAAPAGLRARATQMLDALKQ